MSECVRSGYCCKTGTCSVGVANGAEPKGCKFLMGDRPGEFSCALAERYSEALAIGAGCNSSMNSTRRALLRSKGSGDR